MYLRHTKNNYSVWILQKRYKKWMHRDVYPNLKIKYEGLNKKRILVLLSAGCACVCGAFYWVERAIRSSLKLSINLPDDQRNNIHTPTKDTDASQDTLVKPKPVKHLKKYLRKKVAIYKHSPRKGDDHKSLVDRARTRELSPKIFPSMVQAAPLPESLENDFRVILSMLSTAQSGVACEGNSCLNYYTVRSLQEGDHEDERRAIYGANLAGGSGELSFIMSLNKKQDSDEFFEIMCLKLLSAYMANPKSRQKFIGMKGLRLLQKMYFMRKTSLMVKRNLAKIIGNIAVDVKYHKEIINAGWLRPLAVWMRSMDTELALQSARTLANLDSKVENVTYEDGLYLIHPIYKNMGPKYADVVFVHGLMGGPFRTWRQQDRKMVGADKPADGTESVRLGTYTFCWPRDWLAKDFSDVRILGVEFDTGLFMFGECPFETEKRSLKKRAEAIVEKLKKADIGCRPIIWVGHSMGGLLIKYILSMCESDPALKHIVHKTKGIVFYGTPHRGSPIADLSIVKMLRPTVEVQELSAGSVELRKLHDTFLQMTMDYRFPLLSFGEGQATPLHNSTGEHIKRYVVPPESSDPGIGAFHIVNTNHQNICKPLDKDSIVYQNLLSFLNKTIPQQRHKDNILRTIVDTFVNDGAGAGKL